LLLSLLSGLIFRAYIIDNKGVYLRIGDRSRGARAPLIRQAFDLARMAMACADFGRRAKMASFSFSSEVTFIGLWVSNGHI